MQTTFKEAILYISIQWVRNDTVTFFWMPLGEKRQSYKINWMPAIQELLLCQRVFKSTETRKHAIKYCHVFVVFAVLRQWK